MKKLLRPHGKNCGCKKTKEYSPALGCPNPTGKLNIQSNIIIIKKAILIILLNMSVFTVNFDFKTLKQDMTYIYIENERIFATNDFMKLNIEKKDSILNLKFKP